MSVLDDDLEAGRLVFGKEKRLLLGWLALLAPIPLPFSQMLEWPLMLVYALFIIFFIQKVEGGSTPTMPLWSLNLLGLLYLPIFFIDLRFSIMRGRFVLALLHLIMFLLVVKLYAMRDEQEKWHLVVASFFLFVGSMATSTHMTVSVYLFAWMPLAAYVLARFSQMHTLDLAARRRERPVETLLPSAAKPPSKLAPTIAVALTLLIAVPLFAVMPRLREPMVLGRGGAGGLIRTTGFSDTVDLNQTSSIRGNREVVIRAQYDDDDYVPGDQRFKGASFDYYRDQQWHRLLNQGEQITPDRRGGRFRVDPELSAMALADPESAGFVRVEIFRERINSPDLLPPQETVALDLGGKDTIPFLFLDPGGSVVLPARPNDTIRYEAWVAKEPQITALLQEQRADRFMPLSGLDQSGISRRMRTLAREVMGEGPDLERILRLERHLLAQYSYTLQFLGREGKNAIEEFLFQYRSGHCELFATSMVLLLRAEGIPARLATGYLGVEYNPLEGYYMVRQENAHAWVEAWTEAEGWQIFDPTPPDGRPAVAQQSLSLFLSQFYDFLTFRWDRWVLTYGAKDQSDFFDDVKEYFRNLWQGLFADDEAGNRGEGGVVDESGRKKFLEESLWQAGLSLFALLAIFSALVGGISYWHYRRTWNGKRAYAKLRKRLVRAGLEVDAVTAPLDLEARAAERFPAAAAPLRRLIALYVRESFAERPLTGEEKIELHALLREIAKGLRDEPDAAWETTAEHA